MVHIILRGPSRSRESGFSRLWMANQHQGRPATWGRNKTAASTRWQESSPGSSAQRHPHQQKRAGHLQIRLRRQARSLPPDAQPPKTPQPGLPAGRQATARSTTHRRRYRRSNRPSCVRFSGRRPLRCGAISSMPRAANARSRASLSQTLSATTRSGTSLVSMKSNHPCARVDSCGRAEQLCTAMGNPRASMAIKILAPLPTFFVSDPVASTARRTKRRIQKAFVGPILSPLLHQLPRLMQRPFEDTLPHPALEGLVERHSWSRIAGAGLSIWLRCPAARKCPSEPCACRFWAAASWVPGRIGNLCA